MAALVGTPTKHLGPFLPPTATPVRPQEVASSLPVLEAEHRRLKLEADKVGQLRAKNANLAEEVSKLPDLKAATAALQQQVVEMQHVREQIVRLQVGASRPLHAVAVWLWRGCLARLGGRRKPVLLGAALKLSAPNHC